MYHWACQTAVNNVVQWVKVNSFFFVLYGSSIQHSESDFFPPGGSPVLAHFLYSDALRLYSGGPLLDAHVWGLE